jgi:hypothetical protein
MPSSEMEKVQRNAYMKAWYAKNRERVLAKIRERMQDPLRRQRISEQRRVRRLANRSEINAKRRARRMFDPDFAERERESVRRAMAKHGAKYNATRKQKNQANPFPARERAKRWRLENPEKERRLGVIRSSCRRARQLQAVGSHTYDQWIEKLNYYGWRCRYCLCPVTEKTAQRDHVIPMAVRPIDWISNIVPACKPCNTKKGARKVGAC